MSHLALTFFGAFQATLDDQPITRFRSANVQGLLVYLSLQADRAFERDVLATLFWPDEPEQTARANLRQSLYQLRKVLRDDAKHQQSTAPPFLLIERHTVQFNPDSDYQLDVTLFAQTVQVEAWERALVHYGGELLPGFNCESLAFEEWLRLEREHRQQQAHEVMSALTQQQIEQGNFIGAEATARRQLEIVPWQEEAHRHLMLALAAQGQRTEALTQYERCSTLMMDELGVMPSPELDELYDQILAGEFDTGGATPALAKVGTTQSGSMQVALPFQAQPVPPHFVGRDEEVAEIAANLRIDTNNMERGPMVALVGMGGTGKTTLAARVAHFLRDDFADGVLWANATTNAPQDILDRWARAYGYDFSGLADAESRATAVRSLLADRTTLLVLDNVEDASQARPLLPTSPTCACLLTTRDLDVTASLNFQPHPVSELAPDSGLQLLSHIVGEARVQTEPEAAAEICQLLHYLPLAVEIAAQLLKSRPRQRLSAMAARLRSAQHRLDLGISDRAVRTSFAVSWGGLDEELQQLFAFQAVFAGRPFTAEAIAYLADIELFDAEDMLYTLVALSLLREEEEHYFRQHPLLADFAREKLDSQQHDLIAEISDEMLLNADFAYGRLVDYYLAFVKENARNYERLEPEWENIIAAIEVAKNQQRWQLVLDYTDSLTETWMTKSRFADARRAYAWADVAARELNDQTMRATTLTRWGIVATEQNAYLEATQHLTASLQHWMELEEDQGVADAQFHLARIALEQSDYEDAEEKLTGCLSLYNLLQDKSGTAKALFRRARIRYLHNNLAEAEATALTAQRLQTEIADEINLIPTLRLLGHIAAKNQQFEDALRYCKQAQELSTKLQYQGELAATHYTLTCIYRDQGDFESAKQHANAGLPIMQHIGIRQTEGQTLYQLSIIHHEIGDEQYALELAQKSLIIRRALRNSLGTALTLRHLGTLHLAGGNRTAAQQAWVEALAISQKLKQKGLVQSLQDYLTTI
ncbi:tetratricopeptide repeat protein [Chloroflexi bacterium TSY]|nr:tetratricopeptide repeat protein [Chloroflexi bacterium TSY]